MVVLWSFFVGAAKAILGLLSVSAVLLAVYGFYLSVKIGGKSGKGKRFSGLLVGHRGCMHIPEGDEVIPENTMPSFTFAADHGAQGIELDCMLTKDEEIIVFHDFKLNRLLNVDGQVADLTLKEIQSIPFPNFRNGTVFAPRLEDVLIFAKERKLAVFVETKEIFPKKACILAKKVVQLIEKHDMVNDVVVISFGVPGVYFLRKFSPTIATCLLFFPKVHKELRKLKLVEEGWKMWGIFLIAPIVSLLIKFSSFFIGVDMVGPNVKVVDNNFIKFWRGLGFNIYTWTVNDPDAVANLMKVGISCGTNDVSLQAV
tara:strand:- start:7 stop:948 length:942 start_codon:yes stop_codon:yes gene_type:complete